MGMFKRPEPAEPRLPSYPHFERIYRRRMSKHKFSRNEYITQTTSVMEKKEREIEAPDNNAIQENRERKKETAEEVKQQRIR